MIAASNTDEIAKQLEEYAKEVERRLKHMVQEFTTDVVAYGVDNTPLGDSEKYIGFYQQRQDDSGLLPIEGIARGSWVVSFDGTPAFVPVYGRNSGAESIAEAQMDVVAYKLGDTFYITNNAPYIDSLEDNYSDQTNGQGIMKPTLQQIQSAHEADLKRYYDAG